MSNRKKDYLISSLIVLFASIVIFTLDLPKGTSFAAILIVVIFSVFLYEFRMLTQNKTKYKN
ncbi:hypothetical protein ASF99_09260 [Exiguobacterium sp. Leaf187]|uniref:Uncharacterized protein n=1 Tax=Exiguobacterium indicum TaxID=296995 RepID=A0AAW3MGS8_9BACL|nr:MULTISPECIES: hypothetical protein [Exiguobacterium]KQS20062.1 hypothetical protein ASF99_09260 [Exiguobacterium sp. Leaf187]KTR28267.1 hypothetical protein RSA11_02285 [Exiguobacterium indicum]